MEQESITVLPGDPIDPEAIPASRKQPLRLGPGLQLIHPNVILPTVAGRLMVEQRKNTIWTESNGGKVYYIRFVHPSPSATA